MSGGVLALSVGGTGCQEQIGDGGNRACLWPKRLDMRVRVQARVTTTLTTNNCPAARSTLATMATLLGWRRAAAYAHQSRIAPFACTAQRPHSDEVAPWSLPLPKREVMHDRFARALTVRK